MKKFFIMVLTSFVVITIIAFSSNLNYNTLKNSDYLRIHIRANSNSQTDQNVKYLIKDKFVDYLAPRLSDCASKKDVLELVLAQKSLLENLADEILKQNNFDYKSNVKIASEQFPTRTYEGYTLESGVYDAIIVELGSASGNNWWCVIYPPLCFTNFSCAENMKIVYKSKILEIIKQFFS